MVWKIGVNLHNFVPGCVSLAVGLTLGITALAQERQPQAVAVTPSECLGSHKVPLLLQEWNRSIWSAIP